MPARHPLLPVLAALFLALLSACTGAEDKLDEGPTVLAASSLQEALSEVAEAWAQAGHPPPRLSFAGSSSLARQIEAGAPADLFISADEEWMDYLAAARLVQEGSRADLLTNELVVVTTVGHPALDLSARGERIALADEAVPAGRYARTALKKMGLWDEVQARVVPVENVRAALALVERGEVSAAIVYATDAKASDRVVTALQIPSGNHPPIVYPAAVLVEAGHPDAGAFHAFLSSPQAQRIFERRGFGIAEGAGR